MPKTRVTTTLRIFLASPSDVAVEREIATRVVDEINNLFSTDDGVHLELVKWETHSFPEIGVYPQGVINEQLFQEIDIFLGVMWARFGMATERAGSGTHEEFLLAKAKFERDKGSISIMVYFKDTPLSLSKINVEQYSKVSEFRESLGEEGVYHWTFNSSDDFEKLLRMHLILQKKKWLNRISKEEFGERKADVRQKTSRISLEDDEDEGLGLLDLLEIYEDSFAEFSAAFERIRVYADEISQEMERTDSSVKSLPRDENGNADRRAAKKVLSLFAREVQSFSKRVEIEVSIFSKAFDCGFEAFLKIINLSDLNIKSEKEQVKSLEFELGRMHAIFSGLHQSIGELQEGISTWPNLTRDLKRSQKHANKILDDFKTALESKNNLIVQASSTLKNL